MAWFRRVRTQSTREWIGGKKSEVLSFFWKRSCVFWVSCKLLQYSPGSSLRRLQTLSSAHGYIRYFFMNFGDRFVSIVVDTVNNGRILSPYRTSYTIIWTSLSTKWTDIFYANGYHLKSHLRFPSSGMIEVKRWFNIKKKTFACTNISVSISLGVFSVILCIMNTNL